MSTDQPSELRSSADDVRTLSGGREQSLLHQWQDRNEKGEPYSAKEIQQRIEEIDKNIDALSYDTDIERSMYLAVLERMRLRQKLGVGDARIRDLQQKDVQILKDLDRRITYWQYEDAALQELTVGILDYEDYRTQFKLDQPEKDGGVPRDMKMEQEVLAQRDALFVVLPKLIVVRRLSIQEYRLSLQPENPQLRMQIASLLAKLTPEERSMDRSELAGSIREQVRVILGTPSDEIKQKKLRTPKILALHRAAIMRQFDEIVQRRMQLAGDASTAAEQKKTELMKEQERLLDHALSFHIRSLSNEAQKTSLLTRESHFGLPVDDSDAAGPSVRPYGPLQPPDREALTRERDAHIQSLQDYVHYMRSVVLRQNKSIDVPVIGNVQLDPSLIIEDIMTTHVIPSKLALAEPIARNATYLWGVHDAAWGTVGLDFDIREARTQAILAPIYKRLGLPDNYSDLSSEEQVKARNTPEVQARLRSVQTIINEYKQKHGEILQRMQSAVNDLQSLIKIKPPEDLALAGDPMQFDVLPAIDSLKTDEEYAGAYENIFYQLESKLPQDLHVALQEYLGKLQENISLNIDIGDIEMQLGQAFFKETMYALAVLSAEAGGGYLLLRRGVPFAITHAPAAVRLATRSASGLTNLARKVPLSRLRIGKRVLGGAGIALIGLDLLRVIMRDHRLQALPELDGVLAAVELMEKHGNKDARRYEIEMVYLRNQLESLLMQKGSEHMLESLKQQYPVGSSVPEHVVRLKSRLVELQAQMDASKQVFHKLFPLNDPKYLFTDPEREPGNVGVNLRTVNQARTEGEQFALSHYLPSISQWDPKKPIRVQGEGSAFDAAFEKARVEYKQLEEEVAAVLP